MFADVAVITVKAGDGGNGIASFHRDKFTASGGPDGGNGGDGGNIIFQAEKSLSTLIDFRYKKKYIAQNGKDGQSGKRTGKSGDDLIIKVPQGTLIKNNINDKLIKDLSDFEQIVIAKGGKGGAGNMNFATPTRQSPRFAKAGTEGEKLELKLELKLIADVGIIGYPNVGKSTLISVVSAAKPEIANYHFTTLSPVLGVVKYSDDVSFVMADIPGLIEGAWKGVGLGHQFLRHIERCKVFLHVVDVSGSEGRNPLEDFEVINKELKNYNPKLLKRPMLVVGNKCDIADNSSVETFENYVTDKGYKFFGISAVAHRGVKELVDYIVQILSNYPSQIIFEPDNSFIDNENETVQEDIKIELKNGVYNVVSNNKLKRLLNSVNFYDYDSMKYFQRMLVKYGVIKALKEAGAQEGDTIKICETEFDFFE